MAVSAGFGADLFLCLLFIALSDSGPGRPGRDSSRWPIPASGRGTIRSEAILVRANSPVARQRLARADATLLGWARSLGPPRPQLLAPPGGRRPRGFISLLRGCCCGVLRLSLRRHAACA